MNDHDLFGDDMDAEDIREFRQAVADKLAIRPLEDWEIEGAEIEAAERRAGCMGIE